MLGLTFNQGQVELEQNLPRPVPGPQEVRVRVTLAGICSTDLEIAKGYMGFEGVLGHEFVGVVEAPEEPDWDGRRVVAGINCACGICPLCNQGLDRHCSQRTVIGILGRDGVFAEQLTLPRQNLIALPETICDEDAVYAEPLAAVLRVAEQISIGPDTRIAIVGDGRMGLLFAGVGMALGWDLVLVGKHRSKLLKTAIEAAFVSPGEAPQGEFDLAIDCCGSGSGLEEALRLLRPEGKLVLKTTTTQPGSCDLNALVINEISLIGSRCGSIENAVRFLEEGGFRPSSLTTCQFPLSRGCDAFRAAREKDQIKVLLQIDRSGP